MASKRIHEDRIRVLNQEKVDKDGKYVLYWMEHSFRDDLNHALEYAIDRANEARLPLVVGLGLSDDYPEMNLRHATFWCEGIVDLSQRLKARKIGLTIRKGNPAEVALELAGKAREIVTDRGYLRHHRAWRQTVAEQAKRRVTQVESDLVVPVETASDKQEYAARTIRKKIWKHREKFMKGLSSKTPGKDGTRAAPEGIRPDCVETLLEHLDLEAVDPVSDFLKGGISEAQKLFKEFLKKRAGNYAEDRNAPEKIGTSRMSPYLHMGMISPVWLIQQAEKHMSKEDAEAFVEELLIRRELSHNFTHFNDDYDDLKGFLPDWASETLNEHQNDERPQRYSRREIEEGKTHDDYWNAAMKELRETGFMHNYMRMYWGKKVLEWSNTPSYAHKTALYLNNRYFLDGRDANSFANVGWIFGLHDRAWQERPVFGKVRTMKASGLERKADMPAYQDKVQRRAEAIDG